MVSLSHSHFRYSVSQYLTFRSSIIEKKVVLLYTEWFGNLNISLTFKDMEKLYN